MKKLLGIPRGRKREISAAAVNYLYSRVVGKSSYRAIAAQYGVSCQCVHILVAKFPDALRTDAVLCADFCVWYFVQCERPMPGATMDAWLVDRAASVIPDIASEEATE